MLIAMDYKTLRKRYSIIENSRRPITLFSIVLLGMSSVFLGIGTDTESGGDSFGFMLMASVFLTVCGALLAWLYRVRLSESIWQEGIQKYGGRILDYSNKIPLECAVKSGTVIASEALLIDYKKVALLPGSGAVVQENAFTYSISKWLTDEQFQFKLDYFIIKVPLNAQVPHIFIDATSQNHFTRHNDDLWSLNKKLPRANRVTDLEGDFNKHFKVYAANPRALDSLVILTPDVMLELKERGHNFDYELYKDHLYLIHDSQILSREDFGACLEAIDACLREFVPQVANHTFESIANTIPVTISRMQRWAIFYNLWILLRKTSTIITAYIVGCLLGVLLKNLW